MKNYKYILLDWDGNLAKTLDVWLVACRTFLEEHGLNLSDLEIAESFGALESYLEKWGFADPDAAMSEIDQLAKQKLPDVELYPDVLEVLEILHESNKKLALITTSQRNNVNHLLEKYNMSRLFDVIITGDEVSHRKPHPEPLEKALRSLEGSKDNALMIGDSDKDIGAANNAGIDSVLFYPPEHEKFHSLEKLKQLNPTYVVDDFRKIKDIINSKK